MTIISRTKGDKKGIWAEIWSSQSGATGEYHSECVIYQDKRVIGSLDGEYFDSATLCIRGTFDYRGEFSGTIHDEPVPDRIIDEAINLTIADLLVIKRIMEHWESEGEEHADMWEEVK
ncbi:MAG: hypothetical protein DRQ88_11560 [Epsilonproteobacteria bacterium]|nr:MAG: hypothetical protein DRQ88_11560 [Campylobacterota bacterium]